MEVLTIGYQGRRLGDLTAALQGHDVDVVLDVRQFAWSRKPGFSKGQLRQALACAGIDYLHEPRLGSPTALRRSYRASGEWETFRGGYLAHLQGLSDVIGEYVARLAGRRVCLLCFEGEAALCHRSLLADKFGELLATRPSHL